MIEQHLAQRHRPVIRLFVSSTFSDLKHERNTLQANVWPALERYCGQRGFQFQAIDLRWGVPTEAGLDHRTMRICFDELRRSQETSPQPNFLSLLGDRYGWRPLPEEITTDEYATLVDNVPQEPDEAGEEPASLTVLKAWYPLDENAVPLVHVLRSRRDSPDGRDYTDEQNWNEVQNVLWSIINRAFSPDRLPGRFDEHAEPGVTPGTTPSMVRFQASATEQEIWHGALQVADARQHVFAFVRKIENLDESVRQGNGERRLKDFVDLTPDGQRDTVAQQAHDALRLALQWRLGENYREITTTARLETPPNQPELDVTTDHLALLCQEVQTRLERVIDQQIREYWQEVQAADEQQPAAAPAPTSSPAPGAARIARELELEIEEHVRFGRERAPQEGFVGRESEIGRLREYLASDDRQPLVVYGRSGTGKTALLAHMALPDVTSLGDSLPLGRPLTLVRFLGTTPGSSGVRPLLTSLCRQLRDFFPLDVELPSDLNELTKEFHEQLARATPERPIHLFLDALDQLDDADAGRQIGWLRVSPSQPLPQHVKLVVSCLSDADDIPAGAPYRRLSHPDLLNRGIKLEELSPEEAVSLLFDRWLKSSLQPGEPVTDPFGRRRRTLTTEQRDVVERHIRRPEARECRRPLYLKILFEEARLWRSFDPVPPLGDSVYALFQSLFRRLRRRDQHGRLVRPALGYLVSARYGLTETELLEILFADPDYKAHLDQFNAATGHQFPPGAKRIPIALWARLRYDLAPYLTERAAPGGSVLNFYHRNLFKTVREHYLPSEEQQRQAHVRLAEYFNNQATPNAHSLEELPFHLAKAERYEELVHLFGEIRYLDQRSSLCDIYQLVQDYELVPDGRKAAVLPYRDFLRKHAQRLTRYCGLFFTLIQHEGVSEIRAKALVLADAGLWHKPWLRTTEAWVPAIPPTTETSSEVEILTRHEFGHSAAVTLAEGRALAFFVLKLGEVGVVDLNLGCPQGKTISGRRVPPLALFCSADARYLVVAGEDGQAELLKLDFDRQGMLVGDSRLITFGYLVTEVETPMMAFIGDDLWFQASSGGLAKLPLTEELSARTIALTSEADKGELSGVVGLAQGIAVFSRQARDTRLVIVRTDGSISSMVRPNADVTALCRFGSDRVAASFTDGKVIVFDASSEVIELAGITFPELVFCVTSVGSDLVWPSQGSLHRWKVARGSEVEEIGTGGPDFRRSRHLAAMSDGSLATVTETLALRFAISSGSQSRSRQFAAVFAEPGGAGYYAIEIRNRGIALVDGVFRKEEIIEPNTEDPHTFGLDGQSFLLCARKHGAGILADLRNNRARRVDGIPPDVTSVAGRDRGGFWLADLSGGISFVDAAGSCRLAGRIRLTEIARPIIRCWGDLVVWVGECQYQTEFGRDTLFAAVFFREAGGHTCILTEIGIRVFAKTEGMFTTLAHDFAGGRLMLAFSGWLKFGTPHEFLNQSEQAYPLADLKVDVSSAVFTPDGSILYLLTDRGSLHCLDARTLKPLSVLSGSSPITAMTQNSAPDGSVFLIINRSSLYNCLLKGRRSP